MAKSMDRAIIWRSWRTANKNSTTFVWAHRELAMKGLEHNRVIEQILQEMTQINLELMKEGAYEDD